MFNPRDWYWFKQDGSLYSSAAQAIIVDDQDEDYLAWKVDDRLPTPYPTDEAGVESEAELVTVLARYGLTLWPVSNEQRLAAFTADKRWKVETGGINVGGLQVATDDRSKMMIMGARIAASEDPEFETKWKTADGAFVTIDAATVIAVSNAVLAHVDACFATEAVLLAEIEAGTITEPAEIDAAAWPG